jgi:hypothetical protein
MDFTRIERKPHGLQRYALYLLFVQRFRINGTAARGGRGELGIAAMEDAARRAAVAAIDRPRPEASARCSGQCFLSERSIGAV